MATSFQLYVDKENTSHALKQGFSQPLGVREVGLTPNVKTFAGNDTSVSRPRSALKDVNSINIQPTSNKLKHNVAPVQNLFKKPEPRDQELNIHKKSEKQRSKISASEGKQRIVHKQPDPLPDIEHMHIFNEMDEIKPHRDPNFTGLLGKLRNWKPPCFFGDKYRRDSDEESVEDLDVTPHPEPELDLIPLEMVDLDEDIEIPIPNIDKDLPIPYLDDSLDIEPNLGTLEIYDSSTPMKK